MSGLFIAPSTVFSDMFRMAVVHLIYNLPVDVCDETAEGVVREVAKNIDANPEKLNHVIRIIYDGAMVDENWGPVAVKLLSDLCDLIPATLVDTNTPTMITGEPRTGARLVRHHIYKLLLSDFEADLQKGNWSKPRTWLLAELAAAKSSPLLMSQKTNVWILDMMAASEHLFDNDNLDLFIDYVDFAALGLDEHAPTKAELTRVLEKVRKRAEKADEDLMSKVKVTGLIALRRSDWNM